MFSDILEPISLCAYNRNDDDDDDNDDDEF